MNFFKNFLTNEIDNTIAQIKEEYDHGIVRFGLNPACKELFEVRLRQTLLERKDLHLFLAVELQVVQELILRAEEKLTQSLEEEEPAPITQSYADRIIEEFQSRIKDYPELFLGDFSQKSPDVEKLYGCLEWFSKNLWNELYSRLVKKNPSSILYKLDDEVASLVSFQGKFPKIIERYVDFLTNDAPANEITKVQNQCLLTAAHFLHRMNRVLENFLNEGQEEKWIKEDPSSEDLEFLEKTLQFLNQTLYDFRLTNLKPSI